MIGEVLEEFRKDLFTVHPLNGDKPYEPVNGATVKMLSGMALGYHLTMTAAPALQAGLDRVTPVISAPGLSAPSPAAPSF